MKKKLSAVSNYERKLIISAAICMSLLFVHTGTDAQEKWGLTVRPGVNFAVKDLGDANLKTGVGFEATIGYRFMQHLGAYTGWGWNKFASDNSFAGSSVDFEETGYCFGLQFIHPVSNSSINWMAGAGAVYKHIEVENSKGDIIADSGHGWGWEVEGGLSVALGKQLSLMPGIRYRSLSRDIKIDEATTPVDLQYISIGLGLKFNF